nr:protein sip-5 [uncultured Pseudoxanthomonas sp.]
MRFEQLLQHVQRAEQRVELRATHTQVQWITLKQSWRAGWTPGRIVIAGVVSGFLVGRAEPLRTLTGARWMQMFTAVSSFLATAQAAAAAETAEQAADTAQDAQEQAEGLADDEPMVDEAFDEDEIVVTAPRPAEAATELSER